MSEHAGTTEKDLAKRLGSDPIIGPELPTWLREAIARRVIEWGYARPIPPGRGDAARGEA